MGFDPKKWYIDEDLRDRLTRMEEQYKSLNDKMDIVTKKLDETCTMLFNGKGRSMMSRIIKLETGLKTTHKIFTAIISILTLAVAFIGCYLRL